MGGIVRQVELVWEERGEGFGRGRAGVKTCSWAGGGVPGSQHLLLDTEPRSWKPVEGIERNESLIALSRTN